jgi:hypothetical protein
MLGQIVWHSLHMLPLVAALGVALSAAVLWLYPAQVKRVRWPWRWLLPGLRLLGLLVLCASLLQPAILRPRQENERGAVLILVDRSKSMSVTDLNRTPAQLVALADGLGRLPQGVRSAEAGALAIELQRLRDRVGDVLSAQNDAETAEAFGRGVEAARGRLATTRNAFSAAVSAVISRKTALPAGGELAARIAALSQIQSSSSGAADAWAADARAKIDAAQAAVEAFQSDVDANLYASNLQVKGICDELARLSRWSLTEQALLRPETGLLSRLKSVGIPAAVYNLSTGIAPLSRVPTDSLGAAPDRVGSNIAGAVPAVLSLVGQKPVRAVVMFSDGRQVGGDPSIVSGLSPVGAPVFAVGVAPLERPRDLAIAQDVAIPSSAFVGETMTVRASILAIGQPAGAVDVQLKAGDAEPMTQRIAIKADGTPAPVEFAVRLEKGGPQRFTLSVPPATGEITAENNVIERWVKVLPERMKVAAYAGSAGWDFQLLRGLLSSTPWVKLESAMLDPGGPRFPLTPEQILQQDVIVLSDVPAGALDDVQWDAVNRLVRERGGSLFLLAGPDFLPSTYTPETIVASSLLPFDVRSVSPNWRTWPGEQAAFRLTPGGQLNAEQTEALGIGAGQGSVRNWQSMPAVFRVLSIPQLSSRDDAHALLIESDSRAAVLAESFPGSGRVLLLGMNETWRWRHKVGGRDFARFWLQLIRYAAGEPYAVQQERVALDADRVAISPGESLNVRARILQNDADGFRLDVMHEGQVVQSQRLTPTGPRGGGRYLTSVSGLGDGTYQLRLSNPVAENPTSPVLEIPLQVATRSETEMADVSGDNALLARIADASGGQFLPIERLRDLAGLLESSGANRSRYSELSIWDHPLLFVFVVACFGAEWALRKRLGLA